MAGLWVGIALHIAARKTAILRDAERDVANLTLTIGEEVERTLTGIDQVLHFMAADYHDGPAAFDFEAWGRRSISMRGLLLQLGMANAAGDFVASTLKVPGGNDRLQISDREFFRVHAARKDVGLFVAKSTIGAISKSSGFQLSRRLDDSDGEFAGIVFATVDVARLSRRFASVDLGPGGRVTLVGQDGKVRASSAATDSRDAGLGACRPQVAAQEPERNDAAERLIGCRDLLDLGLIVVVRRDVSDVLAPLTSEISTAIMVGSGMTLALATVLFLLAREFDRRRQQERDLSLARDDLIAAGRSAGEANRFLRLAESIAHVGHWRIDGPTNELFWSDEVYRIFGEEPSTRRPHRHPSAFAYHPDDRERVRIAMREAFGAGFVDYAARIVRANNAVRHVIVRGFSQVTESGSRSLFGIIMDVTDHRQAEREAAEKSNLLATTLESMDQGLIVVSGENRIEICNARALALLDLPPELMADRPSPEVMLAHQWTTGEFGAEDDKLHALMRLRPDVTQTHSHVRPDGSILEIQTRPKSGGGMVQTFTDVTEQRRAEEALSLSESHHRLLAETTSDVITQLDLEYRREYVSPACRRMFGYEPAELLGKRPSDSIHADDVAAVRDVARRLVSGEIAERRVTATYRTLHKAGHWIWVEASLSLVHNAGGTPTGIVSSLRDVTERKAAEVAVETSEARYRLLADNVSDLIVLEYADERRPYISPAVTTMLGFSVEEANRLGMSDWIHPEDRARVQAAVRGLDEASSTRSVLYRLRRKDGDYVWAEAAIRRVDKEGEITIVSAIRDVSERQGQAEALDQARVAAERARNDAERAKAAAEAASQAKTDFLASMSHEIRTPLNGILGYTESLLDDGTLDTRQRRQLERVQAAGSALLTVVNDILDFSKIEAGEIELDVEPFHLDRLGDDAISIIRGIAGSKELSVELEIDPRVPNLLVGDQNRLRQVLLNLLNNSVKFTPSGSVRLSVGSLGLHGGACKLCFAVTDTGLGIPEAKLGRLFHHFSQVDTSIARRFGGTGLGLAISKRLVERMGGEIGVRSTFGEGSTFWFTVALPEAIGRVEPIPNEPHAPIVGQSARLLLVDDLELNRDLAGSILEKLGYEVDTVCDGADAVRAVATRSYDLVLMDIQMPGMDGITATRHIRELPGPESRTPIVAMTANVLPQHVAQFREAGLDDHIGKPFKRSELQSLVERHLVGKVVASAEFVASPVDPSVYRDMLDAVGTDRMIDLLGKLSRHLADAASWTKIDSNASAELAAEAHKMVSAAGMLGFLELSGACAELEAISRAGGATSTAMVRVRCARQRAIDELEVMRRAA